MGNLENWIYPGIGEGSLPLSTYQLPDLLLLSNPRVCYLLHHMQPYNATGGHQLIGERI